MKIFFLLTLFTFSSAFADNESALRKKIDTVISDLSAYQNSHKTVNIDDVLKTQSIQESQLLNAMLLTYSYLKEYNLTERYVFLFSGLETYAQAKAQDNFKIFENFLTETNQRMVYLGLKPAFYDRWNVYLESMKAQLTPLKMKTRNAPIETDMMVMNRALNNLNDSKKMIYGLDKNLKTNGPVVTEIVYSPLPFVAGAVFFVMGLGVLFLSRKKSVRVIEIPVPTTAMTFQPEIMEASPMIVPRESIQGEVETLVDIDKKFRKVFDDNKHLLDVSAIKLHSPAQSPFKTEVHGSNEVITEGLNSLLKGTLAIANNAHKKPSHIDWNCKEKAGRIGVEVTLHGVECDQQNLYMQSLLDGYGSAPAHFGRAERILSNNGANVTISSANNKTTVYLGLDAVSHPFYQN